MVDGMDGEEIIVDGLSAKRPAPAPIGDVDTFDFIEDFARSAKQAKVQDWRRRRQCPSVGSNGRGS